MALSLQVAKVPCGHLVERAVAATLASVTVESPTPSGGELERFPCRSAQVARPCDVRRDHTEGQYASFDSNPSGKLHLHTCCARRTAALPPLLLQLFVQSPPPLTSHRSYPIQFGFTA